MKPNEILARVDEAFPTLPTGAREAVVDACDVSDEPLTDAEREELVSYLHALELARMWDTRSKAVVDLLFIAAKAAQDTMRKEGY